MKQPSELEIYLFDLKGFIVGDNKFLTDNEGNFLTFTYDGVGGLMAVEGTTFMDNASQYCLGAGTIPGKGFEMGHCKINLMDGDAVFTYYEIPIGDSMNGTFKCLGGTGKYKGIECSGSTGYTPINSAQENKFASSRLFIPDEVFLILSFNSILCFGYFFKINSILFFI